MSCQRVWENGFVWSSLKPHSLPAQSALNTPLPVAPLLTPQNCRSEEHTSELQSRGHLVCRLLLEKKKNNPRFTLPDQLTLIFKRLSLTIYTYILITVSLVH